LEGGTVWRVAGGWREAGGRLAGGWREAPIGVGQTAGITDWAPNGLDADWRARSGLGGCLCWSGKFFREILSIWKVWDCLMVPGA